MHNEIQQYVAEMQEESTLSALSQECYERDIRYHADYLQHRGITAWNQVEDRHLQAYWQEMKQQGKAMTTIHRSVVSLRAFYKFLWGQKKMPQPLAVADQSPSTSKMDEVPPYILRLDEVEALLRAPDPATITGIRDQAMLETLYATGARVSELLGIHLQHLQLEMGFVRLTEPSLKERIVPLGPMAVEAIKRYLTDSRPRLIASSSQPHTYLFLNSRGGGLTRQGFWKLLKNYSRQASIGDERLTPHTIRHSFTVHMLDNGADPRTLQELLGHSDTHFIQKYMPLLKEYRLKEAYERAHPRSRMNLPASD